MAETTTVARPYARAAFEQARDKGEFERWSDLLQIGAQVAADSSMRLLLVHPKVSYEDKAEAFMELCETLYKQASGEKGKKGRLPKAGRNFIRLLAENHRLDALPEIATVFDELRAEAEKTVHAELISALAVSDEQRERIAAALKARLKREVVLECTVDESLLGGAVIRAGDLVIDGSAQGQLERLSTALRH